MFSHSEHSTSANQFSRRAMLRATSCGFGFTAFSAMAARQAQAEQRRAGSENPLVPLAPHFEAKAKRVIFLCMQGGPSHVDTFDYKPDLAKDDGKPAPKFGGRKLMASPWKFEKHGESGIEISELFPHLSRHADDLCLLNGMYGDLPAHPEAFVQLHTGNAQFVRPSVGAWTTYGLGTENEDLPGFVTISPPTRLGGSQNYGSAFLPAVYQGTPVGLSDRTLKGAQLANLSNPRLDREQQRHQLDLLQSMNRDLAERKGAASPIDSVIESYELAFRMQSAVPAVLDFASESAETMAAYGIDEKSTDRFGRQCLLARRLAEAGVRYIELQYSGWDQHGGLKAKLESNCRGTDQPIAALLADLKERGMLKDTLVVWGGEFGRTPHVKKRDGRDHNATGFSFWMAGGGVRGGMRYGATDEHGIAAVENRVHFHDLHATMLHLLGLDHERLTYRYSGRDFRLTDVFGNVIHDIIT